LVELLIAFALIGLITLLLFSGLRLGTHAWEGVDRIAERTAELRLARNFLEQALRQSQAVTLTIDAAPYLVFSGDAENLEFVAPLSEHVGIPGLYVLRLRLDQGTPRRLLLNRWLLHTDVLNGTQEIPEWEPFDGTSGPSNLGSTQDEDLAAGAFGTTLLVDDVAGFELAYFGVEDGEVPGATGRWHEEWLDQRRPPMAVRLHLTAAEQSWPDMLIRLPEPEE
jgi:general secretion pathway protein J